MSVSLKDLLSPTGVVTSLKAGNKKQLLQSLAARAAEETGLPERRILEAVSERERAGSTGVGDGIAIPHGRLAGLKHVTGLFARIDPAVDFDSIDQQPVDLVFMLLTPPEAGGDHLKALARVSRMFRDEALVEKLRGARSDDAAYALLADAGHSKAA